jgi:hypothetical protein
MAKEGIPMLILLKKNTDEFFSSSLKKYIWDHEKRVFEKRRETDAEKRVGVFRKLGAEISG